MSDGRQVEDVLNDAQRAALASRARTATLAALRALAGEARVDAIREHALEHGGFSARELAQPSPRKGFARLVELELWQALARLQSEGLVESVPPAHWRLVSADPSRDRLRAMPFEEYLQTPEWRRRRAAALTDRSCAIEPQHTTDLEVHHRNRERLGAETAEDLVVLCGSCYILWHRAYGLTRTPPAADAGEREPVAEPAPSRAPRRPLFGRLLPR